MSENALPLFQRLKEVFGEQVQSMRADRDDEIYFVTLGRDVRPIVQFLQSEYEARVVSVFAEDRRFEEGVFFNYYVLEQSGNPQFLILQAPVPSRDPQFR